MGDEIVTTLCAAHGGGVTINLVLLIVRVFRDS